MIIKMNLKWHPICSRDKMGMKTIWKREVMPMNESRDRNLKIVRMVRSSPSPGDASPTSNTPLNHEWDVSSQQTPGDYHRNAIIYYLSIIIGSCLILIALMIALIMVRRKKKKNADKENAQSILIYPCGKQNNLPEFWTKEKLHFSLPPLRSSSLEDLTEGDIDTNLLVPPNQRSNSFSCYGLGVIEPALYMNSLDLDEIQWPEGHIGRIWFSLRYEPSTEKLLISLLKAKNLPSRTVGTVNSCDPFVRLHLMPDERRYLQSKQRKKTCNPYFDETLVFQVSAKDMSDHILKLTVIDGGRTKRRSEIGHVTFPLKDLEIGDGSEQQLFKLDLEKEPREIKPQLGELLISLGYNANSARLSAAVLEARGLQFQGDKHEAYVRLTLNQHNRSPKERRTEMARPNKDGTLTFSQGFHFKLAPSQVDITNLAFHVFQSTSGYGRGGKLIGKCVLGSHMFARGRALTQWNLATTKHMEQLEQWHTLCE